MKTSELELDKAAVEEQQYEEYGKFDVLQEVSENLEDIVAEMSAVECPYDGCTSGERGARFKTPALAPQHAQEYLKFHIEDVHGRQVVGVGGGFDKAWFAEIPQPSFRPLMATPSTWTRTLSRGTSPSSSRRRRT